MIDDHHVVQTDGAALDARPPRSNDVIPGRHLAVTRGSQVKAKRLVWWELGLVLQSAINLLAAREGKGKSTVASSWAARETRNGGTVLWIGTEESREAAIVPRLIASGADMDRVIFVDVETDLGNGALVFPLDLHGIEAVIRQQHVTMLFLDPAKAVVPSGFSGNDDIAVRQYLEPIAGLADRCKVTIVGLAHFGKRSGADSGQLMLGSVAWSQVARCVLSIAEDPDTGTRVLTNTKANYVGTDRSVEFRIVGTTIDTEDGPTEIGSVEWLGDSTLDARDLLDGVGDEDARDVDLWLRQFLATGSKKANEVYTAVDAAGYSKDQAKRAKKRLGVRAERPSGDGPWFWSLPNAVDQGSTDQGSTPVARVTAPLLPCTSEGVQQPENRPREQRAEECSLGPPSPASMPLRPAYAKPERKPRERTYGKYRPPTGPGRCPSCGWHVETQGGHNPNCSANEASA